MLSYTVFQLYKIISGIIDFICNHAVLIKSSKGKFKNLKVHQTFSPSNPVYFCTIKN